MGRKSSLVFCLSLIASVASAQSVDEILAKHYAARGGLEKLKAVKSMRLTGEMTAGPGMTAPVTIETKRPNLMRVEFTVQGMTGTQAYDGQTAWMVMPFMGITSPQPMPAAEARDVAEQADIDGVLVDHAAKGHTVELIGREAVNGADAYKLRVTTKSGDVRLVFLDAKSWLEVRAERKRTIQGSEMEFESTLGDYRNVGGLMVPHAFESGPKGGQMRQSLTVTKVEIDPPIDDARFKMPAPAAKP